MEKYEGFLATIDVLRSCEDEEIKNILKGFPKLVLKVVFSAVTDEVLAEGIGFELHDAVWQVSQEGEKLTILKDDYKTGLREALVVKDFSKINRLEKRTLKDAAYYQSDDMAGSVKQSYFCFTRLNDGYKIYLKQQTHFEDNVVDEADRFIDVRAKYFQNGLELIKSPSLQKRVVTFAELTRKEKVKTLIEVLSQDRELKRDIEFIAKNGGKLTYKKNVATMETTTEDNITVRAEFLLNAEVDNLLSNKSAGVIARITEIQPSGLKIVDTYKLDYDFIKPPYAVVYEGEVDNKEDREYYIDNHSMIVLKQEREKSLKQFTLAGKSLNKTICEIDKEIVFKTTEQNVEKTIDK